MINHTQTHEVARITLATYIKVCGCKSTTDIFCALAAMLSTAAKLAIDARDKATALEMLEILHELIAKPETNNNTGIELVYRTQH